MYQTAKIGWPSGCQLAFGRRLLNDLKNCIYFHFYLIPLVKAPKKITLKQKHRIKNFQSAFGCTSTQKLVKIHNNYQQKP